MQKNTKKKKATKKIRSKKHSSTGKSVLCRRSVEWNTYLKDLSQEYKRMLKLDRAPTLCQVERIELLKLRGYSPYVCKKNGRMVVSI